MSFRVKPVLPVTLFLAVSLLVFGCDSGGPEDGEGDPDNEPPVADISVAPAPSVEVGEEVTLDGSGSEDPDGDELAYTWSLDAPSGSSADLSSTSTEVSFTPDVDGDYTATLEVADGEETDTDEVTITTEATTVEINSDITSDRTLTPDEAYVVTSTICVDNNSTLTIEDGVRIEFESGTGLKICGDGSALVAQGTVSNGITFTGATEQAGFWKGIGFSSANVNNELSGVTLEYAGGGDLYTFIEATAALQLGDGSKVSITNSTFRNNDAYGIQADEGVEFTDFSDNTFESNERTSMNVQADNIGSMDTGTSYESYVHVYGGHISDQTLTVSAIDVPYRVAGVRLIQEGSEVTVEAGTTFEFESSGGLKVNGDGTAFKAQGTSSNGITFTGVTKQAGFWNGIGFSSANVDNELSGVTLEYAGGGDLYTFIEATAALQLGDGSKVSITNSTFRDSDAYGIQADEGVEFTDFSDNTFESNERTSMNVRLPNIGAMDTGTSYESYVRVYEGFVSDRTMTVSPIDVPYRIAGVRTIQEGSDVTVEAGTTFEFESNAGLEVNGDATAFRAQGTEADSIVFTGETKQAGFWSGLGFDSSNSTNELSHVKVEYGGGDELYTFIGDAANIQVLEGAYLTLENSLIQDSGDYGVYADDGASAVSENNNTYERNASGGTNY